MWSCTAAARSSLMRAPWSTDPANSRAAPCLALFGAASPPSGPAAMADQVRAAGLGMARGGGGMGAACGAGLRPPSRPVCAQTERAFQRQLQVQRG